MSKNITKQQIIAWLTSLIDQVEPPDQVVQALAALQDFITWWQAIRDRGWDPRLWTPQDEEAYRQTIPVAQWRHTFVWLHRFRQWLVDEAVLQNDGDPP